jgi:probable F420-dependent oxidoreductase
MAELLGHAKAAESVGFDHYVVGDHVALGGKFDEHPGERWDWGPAAFWPDPLVFLAAVAAATTRLRLAPYVLIVPLRPAIVVAKMAATVDSLSGGRLDLCVGSGWAREEFSAAGVPLEGRTQRMEDTIGACRALWTSAPASFESPTVSFTDLWCSPAPVQVGGPPVFFGGPAIEPVARRIAGLGDGWCPMSKYRDQLQAGIALIRQEFELAGRDPESVMVRYGAVMPPAGRTAADGEALRTEVEELAAVGVTHVTLYVPAFAKLPEEIPEALTWMADQLELSSQGAEVG